VAKNKLWNHKIFSLIANILAKHKNNKFVYQFILFAQKLNENFELKLYKKCLRPGMNVIDIGANFGLYSIEASKLISPNGRVFSFEPEPSTYKALENKIKQLGINNVSLSSKALSNKKGHQKFPGNFLKNLSEKYQGKQANNYRGSIDNEIGKQFYLLKLSKKLRVFLFILSHFHLLVNQMRWVMVQLTI